MLLYVISNDSYIIRTLTYCKCRYTGTLLIESLQITYNNRGKFRTSVVLFLDSWFNYVVDKMCDTSVRISSSTALREE
jgi:hypothetical protein